MTYPGTLVLVVGAAGSGKGVLINRAREQHPEIAYPVSATTRDIRPGEIDGKHYHFITKAEFESRIEAGEFLEWAAIDNGNLYGTPRSEIMPALTDSKVILEEMDVQGVHQVQQVLPKENLATIYIDAGSWDTLERRIQDRAPIGTEELESRKRRYEYEQSFKAEADYVVENLDGKFNEADAAFEGILHGIITGAAK